ncbi:MAG: adenosine deaminase [Gemmatimonadetes bacterium]|nr:adenosine deaminase [Gemmatimonadota bacterium]
MLSRDVIRRMPKVLLHDHLDGGLRPRTVIELAQAYGIELPMTEEKALEKWFHEGAMVGNLAKYLEGFGVTCSVMQHPEALTRVAEEMIEDVAADGVAYIETRFSPLFHTQAGLKYDEVVEAVLRGLERGRERHGVRYGVIICAMRSMDPMTSLEMAELALAYRDRGVVGFDLAGDEMGHPPKEHLDAFHLIQRGNFNITIHAGEAFGKESIWQAVQYCGAHRIGHGTRLKEDLMFEGRRVAGIGSLAGYILDRRIPIEICLTSNLHTGAANTYAEHPFRYFFDKHFRVTLNTDNRLMSDVTMTGEYEVAAREYGLGFEDLEKLAINGMKSSFLPYNQRIAVIYDVLKPGYARLRAELGLPRESAIATH